MKICSIGMGAYCLALALDAACQITGIFLYKKNVSTTLL